MGSKTYVGPSLVKHFNLDVTLNAEQTQADVVIPGLSYDDFDRTGNVSIWKISKLFESARLLALISGNFLDFKKLMDNNGTMFVRSGYYTISERLYQSSAIIWPMRATTRLRFLGRTSMNLDIDISDNLTKQNVGTLHFQYVYVNRNTRRSFELPSWFMDQYKSSADLQERPASMVPLELPTNAFSDTVIVQYSDTDRNQHTNQSSYLKYGMDVATRASLTGHFQHFKQDMCVYHIQEFTVLYTGESLVNDKLTVYTWEHPTLTDVLCVQIHKERNSIFHCKIILHCPPIPKL